MKTAAILPVKRFRESKKRLGKRIGAGTRAHLTRAMYGDVLGALLRAETIDEIFVVSPETEAIELARDAGATVIEDPDESGQSEAVELALERLPSLGFDAALLVPGDCPLLDAAEVDDLVRRARAEKLQIAIVPDRHGEGTNALYLLPPDVMEPQFGPGSLERHRGQAEARGVRFGVEELESLALDIDTEDDLQQLRQAFEAGVGRAPRTRGVVWQYDRSAELQDQHEPGTPA